jgi:stage III sporulation protein AD
MEIVKIIGVGLVALVIIIVLKQYRPEYAVYVSLAASILILTLVFKKLFSVIDLLNNLANKTAINTTFIALLIKITGIAILTEFAVSICKDCGESAIASKMDIGGKIMIVTVSIPVISTLLETVVKILP